MKILVVDDKTENLYMLESLLKGSGYEVVSAKNGLEALEKLRKDSFDMIISDILMPKMDGFRLCRECKSDDVLRKIPFIFYTAAYTDTKDEEFALGLGAERYIVKPTKPNKFLEILEGIIKETEEGTIVAAKKPAEEDVYLAQYNKRLIAKLEHKTLNLEKELAERKKAEKALRRTYEDLETAHHQLEESQAQLIQTEKMSALGTLVAGTAHELNNPVTGILNFAAHCIKHTSEEDQLYTVLQDIEHEAKRCAEIVRNLLTFSHTGKDDDKAYQKGNLAEILGRVLKLLSYRIEKQGISVTWHIADDTPEIWMNSNRIQQLILNLATNALDALEDSEKKEFNVDIRREGEFVRMTIADTGCGIAAESLGSIFDPFFTTKPVDQGTGLGLSVSQGIVKVHRGKISCESELGEGTKFTILLPIEKIKEKANV